jgi:hypothetical protein
MSLKDKLSFRKKTSVTPRRKFFSEGSIWGFKLKTKTIMLPIARNFTSSGTTAKLILDSCDGHNLLHWVMELLSKVSE